MEIPSKIIIRDFFISINSRNIIYRINGPTQLLSSYITKKNKIKKKVKSSKRPDDNQPSGNIVNIESPMEILTMSAKSEVKGSVGDTFF